MRPAFRSLTEDEVADGGPCCPDVAVGTEDVDFPVEVKAVVDRKSKSVRRRHGARTHESAKTTRVLVTFSIVYFVRPLLPAILPIARDRLSPFSGLTVTIKGIRRVSNRDRVMQPLTVFDLEGLQEQLVQSQECDGVVDVESEQECAHEVSPLLQVSHVRGFLAVSQFDLSSPRVEAHLQLQVLDERLENLDPVLPQRRVPVSRYGDPPDLPRRLIERDTRAGESGKGKSVEVDHSISPAGLEWRLSLA